MEKFLIVQIKTNNWREEWEKDAKAGWISKNESWHAWSEVNVTQSCPTLWDPLDCSLPGSSVCGILQTSILREGSHFFSRESLQPRDWTLVSCIVNGFFSVWSTRDAEARGEGYEVMNCKAQEPSDLGPWIAPWKNRGVLSPFCSRAFQRILPFGSEFADWQHLRLCLAYSVLTLSWNPA